MNELNLTISEPSHTGIDLQEYCTQVIQLDCQIIISLSRFSFVVSDVLDGGVQADATAYFGTVLANAPSGTEVFHFRIVIDLGRFNNDLDAIVIIMVRNVTVEQILKFSNGQNIRTFPIALHGGIDAVNASGVFPEIRLIENRLVVYEDYIIYHQAQYPGFQVPITFDFDLHLIIVGRNPTNIRQLSPFATGTVLLTLPPGLAVYC